MPSGHRFEHSVCFLNVKYVRVLDHLQQRDRPLSSAVNVTGLSHCYGTHQALADVSFSVPGNGKLALLGPNGAGKTTLFSLLTCLLRPSAGSISIFGHDVTTSPGAALAQLGVVFQQPTLDLDLSLSQNLAYHGAIQGLSPREVRSRSQQELERFGLWQRRHEPVRKLNAGHRRRVEIARALLHQPRLLLLDEATTGLDLASRVSLHDHIRSLVRERGLSVLWTTHLPEELEPDEQVVLLQSGAIQGQGQLSQLVAAAGAEDARALLLGLSSQASPS